MDQYLIHLFKSEDSAGYAARANSGMMLGYPVTIGGESHNPQSGIHYHSTIKVFNKDRDHGHQIHFMAQHLPLNPPDAKNTQIEPSEFKARDGSTVYVLKLHGNSSDKIKEHHGKFASMGDPEPYEFQPHISISKELHDKIKASGAKTAADAQIKFGNAELKRGPKTIKTYFHKPDTTEPAVPDEGDMTAKIPYEPQMGKLTASEKEFLCPLHKAEKENLKPLMKPYVSDAQRRWAHTATGTKALGGEAGVHEWDEATKGKKLPERVGKTEQPLEKGTLKTAGAALGMAAALAGSHPANAENRSPASIPQTKPHVMKPRPENYDHQRMLRAIAQVESSGGINTHHGEGGGPIHGHERAYGKFGLMPETIREIIAGHKDLKTQHQKALALKGNRLHHYMKDHPGLEDTIADRHLTHMEHVLGQDPAHLGFGWLEGTTGTLNARKNGTDIRNHWHAKRVKDAYDKED